MEDRIKIKKPREIKYRQEEARAARLYECHGDQELAWANPIGHTMPFSEGPTSSNSVQYHLNNDLRGLCLERESARYATQVRAARLCECQRDQELAWANPICHTMPFYDGPTSSNSLQYQLNKELCGPCLECESARNATQRHMMEMKMVEKDLQMQILHTKMALSEERKHHEDLQMKINYLQKEIKTCQLLAALQAEELKKDHYESKVYKVDMYHLGAPVNRGNKRSYVCIWQTSGQRRPGMSHASLEMKRPEAGTENIKKEVSIKFEPEVAELPETHKSKLQKKWLEESMEKLRTVSTQASLQNLQEWFQASITNFKEKGPQASKQNLQQWLETTKEHLQEKCPQASRKDVREWLEASLRNIQEEGPDATTMNVEEWLETSMKSIQDFQEKGLEVSRQAVPNKFKQERPQTSKLNIQEQCKTSMRSIQNLQEGHVEESTQTMQEHLEQTRPEVLEVPKDHLRIGWLNTSIENLRRRDSEKSMQNVQEGLQTFMSRLSKTGPEASKQNLQEWLDARIKNLQEECPEESRKDMKEWLEISKSYLLEEGPETSKLDVQEWLKASMRSIQNLQEGCVEESTQTVQEDLEQTKREVPQLPRDHLRRGWLDASIENLRRGGSELSRQNVQEGLQAVISRPSKKGPEASKQNLQEWLDARIKNLEEECPVESRKDMKEWLEISKSYLQEAGPETSKLDVQEWLKACMRSIQNLQEGCVEESTQTVQEDLEQTKPEVPQFPRDHLRKEWLDASIENLRRGGSQLSRQNVQEGLQAVMSRLSKKGPEASKQNLQEWLEARIKNLQEECPEESRKDMKQWLEISKSYLQEEGPETSKLDVQEWLKASTMRLQDLQERGFEGSTQNEQESLPEDPEKINLEVPELPRAHLQEGWLEASIENLRRGGPEASRRNVQEWLRASMTKLKGAPESIKQNLQGWLEASIKNLPEEYPEASRKDVKEWLEVSKSYIRKKGPETSKLNVEQWLHASMSGIQELQSREVSKQNLKVREREESTIGVRPSMEKTNLLEQSFQGSSERAHEQRRSNLIEKGFAASEQYAGKQLQLSSHVDSRERSPRSILDWLSESERNYKAEHLEIPSQPTAVRLGRSIRDFQAEDPGSSTLCVRSGIEASTPKERKGASRLSVQKWLESSMRSLEEAGTEASKQSLQQWLEESTRTLDERCPVKSRHDVQEWLQATKRQLQDPNASKYSAQEWIRASLKSLKEEGTEIPIRDVVEYLQQSIKDLREEASRLTVQEWLEASLIKLQEEDPEASRDDVKEWLESSLRKFRAVSPETSGHYIKKWLESSLRNLHEPRQNLQAYMKESLMHLKAPSFAASTSSHSMRLIVPHSTMEAAGPRGILKHGSYKADSDRWDVSRTSLIPEGNYVDLEEEEAPEISQIFITPEVHSKILKQTEAKGKWLCDQVGVNLKMLIAKVSNAFCRCRKPSKIWLAVVAIVLIGFAYRHYRVYCVPCRGLRPF